MAKKDSGHKFLFWVLTEIHSIKSDQTVISKQYYDAEVNLRKNPTYNTAENDATQDGSKAVEFLVGTDIVTDGYSTIGKKKSLHTASWDSTKLQRKHKIASNSTQKKNTDERKKIPISMEAKM